ncbi:MAG: transcriptional regulator SlyA [Alphaproteobacteria bacterium]
MLDSGDPALRETFALDLTRLARFWRARLDERLRPIGFTQAKWVTLFHLSQGGEGLQQKDIAVHIGVEGPTLVRLLDALEERHLIERRPDPGDRRANTVHLTDKARPLMADLRARATDLRNEFLAGVSDDDLRVCVRVFETIMASPPLEESE